MTLKLVLLAIADIAQKECHFILFYLKKRTQRKTIPDIYICNLAIADLVHIIAIAFSHSPVGTWRRMGFLAALCTTITSLATCNQFTCSDIMTAMSLDRYLALVQPFHLTHLRTRSKTIRVNLCLWMASLILLFPVWVYSKLIKFKDGLESCAFDLTSPDDALWYMLYLTVTTFFFPLPPIFICYVLFLCYAREMYQQNKQAGSYTTSIPRQRIMRFTKVVLALVSMFVISTAPSHVIQLMNLQVSQPTLTFYMSYYVSTCLSYASSHINPFFYILLSGNFQKHLHQCTNMEVRMADQDANVTENTLKSSC